ncbi:MAG: hypothetical protein BA865_01005, partial [Desulfobacterales bacterium S5133MH4]
MGNDDNAYLCRLNLKISRQGEGYAALVEAVPGGEETFQVDPAEIQRLLSRSKLLDTIFNHHRPDQFANEFIHAGAEVFRLFFDPFTEFEALIKRAESKNAPVLISIQSNDHEIDQIPWELLYSPEHGFLGTSPRFQFIRTVAEADSDSELSAGPLRLLFMASSPDGTGPLLNYEDEEEIILNAVAELKQKKKLEIDIAEGGTLEELTTLLAQKNYHVLHLSGHGYYDEGRNTGFLTMENESGTPRQVSAQDLADTLIGNRSVRLLFLSTCQSARETAYNTGLARLLASNGVPMVIGMKQPVRDSAATRIAGSFYRNLTIGWTVSHALQMARHEYEKETHRGFQTIRFPPFQWAVPALFVRDGKTAVVDWKKPPAHTKERAACVVLYGKVKHLKTGFRGRRREVREYLKLLREGSPPALCITGAGGIGKSTLASRLADRLHRAGCVVIPLYGEITHDMFIRKTISALVSARETEHVNYLKELTDYSDKIDYILSNILGTEQWVYLLDNFEDNLKQSAGFREFKNPFWEETFRYILEQLPNTCSKVLITCRYTVPSLSEDRLFQTPLKEMSAPEARKLMLFSREYAGINFMQTREVYSAIGGNPKAIEDLGNLLYQGESTWEALKEKLGIVQKEMREFTIFKTLYDFLDAPAQCFFRKASVYQEPVEEEGLRLQEGDNDLLHQYVKKLVDYSLIQAIEDDIFKQTLFHVHPLHRENIREEWWQEGEKEVAHCRAAEYYLKKTAGLDVDGLSRAVCHLQEAKEYDRMADLITDYARELYLKGFWDESLYLHNFIITDKERIEKRFQATACNNIGGIYYKKGDWDKALEYYLRSEKISLEVGDRAGLAATYNNIGLIYDKKGDWDKALEYYLKSEKISLEVGDRAGLATTYNNIGLIYSKKGDWDKALEYYLKSEKIMLEVGDRAGLATTYNNIGAIYSNKGDWDKALEYYLKDEKISLEVGDRAGLA